MEDCNDLDYSENLLEKIDRENMNEVIYRTKDEIEDRLSDIEYNLNELDRKRNILIEEYKELKSAKEE